MPPRKERPPSSQSASRQSKRLRRPPSRSKTLEPSPDAPKRGRKRRVAHKKKKTEDPERSNYDKKLSRVRHQLSRIRHVVLGVIHPGSTKRHWILIQLSLTIVIRTQAGACADRGVRSRGLARCLQGESATSAGDSTSQGPSFAFHQCHPPVCAILR